MNHIQEMLPDKLREHLVREGSAETKDEKMLMVEELEARAYLKGYRDGLVDGKKFT